MIKLLLFVAVIEIVFPLILLMVRDRMIFLPPSVPTPRDGLSSVVGGRRSGVGIELVAVRRQDGRELAAYDARPTDAPDDIPTVVYFHGNATTIGQLAPFAEHLAALTGLRWFFAEYSGYGGNPGTPSESESRRDAIAVWEHLTGPEGGDTRPESIVLFGQSLGGAVAVRLASERQVGGLILQSSFSSVSSMTLRIYPWMPLVGLFSRGVFPSERLIADIDCPILVVHGTADTIIPIAEGRKLHQAAPPEAEFLVVEGAHHNDFFMVAGDQYLIGLGKKVREWVGD